MTQSIFDDDEKQQYMITPGMVKAGAEVLLFFDSELSDLEEYARKVYIAMVEVSDSET